MLPRYTTLCHGAQVLRALAAKLVPKPGEDAISSPAPVISTPQRRSTLMTPATAARSPLEAEDAAGGAEGALGLGVAGVPLPLRLVDGKWVLMSPS